MQCGHILPVGFSIEIYGKHDIGYKANVLNCGARTHTRVPKCYWVYSDLCFAETRIAPRVSVTHNVLYFVVPLFKINESSRPHTRTVQHTFRAAQKKSCVLFLFIAAC